MGCGFRNVGSLVGILTIYRFVEGIRLQQPGFIAWGERFAYPHRYLIQLQHEQRISLCLEQ